MVTTKRANPDNTIVSKDGVRQGFTQRDSMSLRRETHQPITQIWSAEELEESEPEQRQYYCVCKAPLTYLKGSETIWRCDNCMEFFDLRIQDSPLKDITDSQLRPYTDLMHYPTADADLPFVETINLDSDLEERKPDEQRIQHIKLHNVTFADAIKFSNVLSARKKER